MSRKLAALLLLGAAIGVLSRSPGWTRLLGLWDNGSAITAGLAPEPRVPSPWTLPVAVVWPAQSRWNDRLEQEYADFVAQLGQAIEQRRCGRLDRCLRSPEANLLYDPRVDATLDLEADCAKLPYLLRAYFSFKRRLPFGFVCDIDGKGRDVRYLSAVVPTRFCSWQSFRTPRSVLINTATQVHSGMFRMAPGVETSDFYPTAVTRRAIRPGTIFYDPNGHVLTVAEVRADGSVFLIDGHPDGTLTWKRFGRSYVVGGINQGGGFKNFRPLLLINGELHRERNQALPDFDGQSQWDRERWRALGLGGGQPLDYPSWVHASLAEAGVRPDPVHEFSEELRALCRDLTDRADAVALAVAAGLPMRPHPGALPWNIYGAADEWEAFATPARDTRLKVAFRELRDTALAVPAGGPQRAAMREAWLTLTAQPECHLRYRTSAQGLVELTINDVLDRLFALSFDPYHCPELRWGAPPGSAEGATCPADARKLRWYQEEQRLRNRLERVYESPTPLGAGPAEPPDVDVRRALGLSP